MEKRVVVMVMVVVASSSMGWRKGCKEEFSGPDCGRAESCLCGVIFLNGSCGNPHGAVLQTSGRWGRFCVRADVKAPGPRFQWVFLVHEDTTHDMDYL